MIPMIWPKMLKSKTFTRMKVTMIKCSHCHTIEKAKPMLAAIQEEESSIDVSRREVLEEMSWCAPSSSSQRREGSACRDAPMSPSSQPGAPFHPKSCPADRDIQSVEIHSPAQKELLTQGAAYNGEEAVRKAVSQRYASKPLPTPTAVHLTPGRDPSESTILPTLFCGLDPDKLLWIIRAPGR